MIQDLSQTLRAVLTKTPGLERPLKDAQIVFDRPAESFAPQQTTIDLFLYDVRENVELRSNEPTITRSNGQVIVSPPPLRIACSYLVTAWPSGTGEVALLQEHQLLSQVLHVLSRFPTIPSEFLHGSLAGQAPPLPFVTLHPDALKNISEFWTSLGNKLRPSVTVIATASMPVLVPEAGPAVITEELRFRQTGLASQPAVVFRIGGQVMDAANKEVKGATVTLVELGLSTSTSNDGRYVLGRIPQGTYNLRAQLRQQSRSVKVTVPAPKDKNYDIQLP